MLWSCLAAVVARLPFGSLRLPGALLGWFVACLLRIRRSHAIGALRRARIPRPSTVVAGVYRSLATNVFELLWMSGRPHAPLEPWVRIDPDDWSRLEACLAKGRGLVVASAHCGNWDLVACAMAKRAPLSVVTRHMSWRSANAFWMKSRASRGVRLVEPNATMRAASDSLRAGDAVAFMIDQAPERRHGVVPHPFLGAPAWHDATFAVLALRQRVPIAVVVGQRTERGHHVVRVLDVIEPPSTRSTQWVRDACVRSSEALETFVRANPSQWLWLHRRWKDLP